MRDDDANLFAQRLVMLAEILGESLSPARIGGYWEAVKDFAIDDLCSALDDCAKTCPFFPKPVEIRRRVADARHLRMMEAWRPRPELLEGTSPLALPAHVPPPDETPEARAAQQAKMDALWSDLFKTARRVSAPKAMPAGADEDSPTMRQIRRWRQDHQP